MRHYNDWLEGYLELVSHEEAPRIMQYWAAIGTVGAALERKAYFDMGRFKWFPNFYIIFVGPPETVKKSNTASGGAKLLDKIPDFHIGSNITTWQALVQDMANNTKNIDVPEKEEYEVHSCAYVNIGELGNFLDTDDKKLVNLLIALWDGEKIDKSTKSNGKDYLEYPLLSLMSCTTPSWLMDNVPRTMIDGGLFSRVIFVYADKSERDVAYPKDFMHKDSSLRERNLVADLIDINNYQGEIVISDKAKEFGTEWYIDLKKKQREGGAGASIFQRKQTQVHKVAMVLAAARNNKTKGGRLEISRDILEESIAKIDELEEHRARIFLGIGQSRESQKAELVFSIVQRARKITIEDLYSTVHDDFPKYMDFQAIIRGLFKAGKVTTTKEQDKLYLLFKD